MVLSFHFLKFFTKCHHFFCSHTLPITLSLPIPLILSGTIRSPYRHSKATFHHKWNRFKCVISIHRPDRCSRPKRCRENLCGLQNLTMDAQTEIQFPDTNSSFSPSFEVPAPFLGASTNILAGFKIKEVHRDHLHLPPY